MDAIVVAIVTGVLLSVAFGAFATAFAWLRSDVIARLDKMDDKATPASTRWMPALSG